jgi:acetyl-CoA synthetase
MSSLVPMPNPKGIPTRFNAQSYADQHAASMQDPDAFWSTQGQRLDWFKPFTQVQDVSLAQEDLHIRWYADGVLNACYNCLDRHLPAHADKVAFWWEGDTPDAQSQITYQELYEAVCQFANALKARGVSRGDRVAIYMPMIVEAVVAMLACARIGAVHSVIFGGFSPNAIADRVNDCQARLIITSDEGRRGGQTIPLKANVDKALGGGACPTVDTVIMYRLTGADVAWTVGRDVVWQDLVATQSSACPAEPMAAEDPLFILYTSGSTGQPKGVLHTTGGYMVYASLTHETIFDIQPDDVYWCAADVGWITGHSYIVYGPLANATSSVLFEGVPTSPTPGRVGEIVDKYGVTVLYTAPT